MRITAGLVVIYRESILLVRQYYDTKNNHLSIPKGEALKGENLLNAAIRETEEETGVKVPIEYIDPEPHLLNINNAKLQICAPEPKFAGMCHVDASRDGTRQPISE